MEREKEWQKKEKKPLHRNNGSNGAIIDQIHFLTNFPNETNAWGSLIREKDHPRNTQTIKSGGGWLKSFSICVT